MFLSPELSRQLAADRQAELRRAAGAPWRLRLRLPFRRRPRRTGEGRDGPYVLAA